MSDPVDPDEADPNVKTVMTDAQARIFFLTLQEILEGRHGENLQWATQYTIFRAVLVRSKEFLTELYTDMKEAHGGVEGVVERLGEEMAKDPEAVQAVEVLRVKLRDWINQ